MKHNLLQDLVRVQADYRPEAPAIVAGNETMSYGELERASNQLARLLKEAGCEPGDRVCLLLPKSISALVGMIGTLKADCIYVPMDLNNPPARLRTVCEICECRFILAGKASLAVLEKLIELGVDPEIRIGWMDPGSSGPSREPAFRRDDFGAVSAQPVDSKNSSSDVAHILFTSGSTGVPKGVMITHSNVMHFIEWATRYFGFSCADRISGHPPLHFDLSTFDIYGTFLAGASLYLFPPELNVLPHKVAHFIRSNELTQWFSVPSLLNYMSKFDVVKQGDFPSLRRLLWCGEAFPTPALMYWMKRLPHVSFTNLYGPTEATIASSYYHLPECPRDETQMIPIGQACEGEWLSVLDEHLNPVETGRIGELYIGGVGLSPGYWRDAEKTEAAFRKNPDAGAPARIYRTGDLASVGGDGLVYLHGRADSQIKSRGYRIELGEIERALNALEGLRESAVVGVELDGFEGVAISCAYVPAPGARVSSAMLREKLAETLPRYMVPSHWLTLDTLPRNGNAKVDRNRLREQFRLMKSGGQG